MSLARPKFPARAASADGGHRGGGDDSGNGNADEGRSRPERVAPTRPPRAATLGNLVVKTLSVPVEKACRLLLIAVAAPILGEGGFGRYQYADAVTTLFVLATDFGLGIWTTRALARTPERADAIVGTGLWVKTWAALPYLVLVVAAALVTRETEVRQALLLLGIATLAGSVIEYCNAIFRGFERLRDEGRLNSVRAVAVTAAALAGVWSARSVLGLVSGLTLGTVGAAAYGLFILQRHYRLPGLALSLGLGLGPGARRATRTTARDARLAKTAIKEALPLWIAALLSLVYFKGDTVLLRVFAGDAAVGSYSAAYKIFEATMVLPAIVMAAAFPALTRLGSAPSGPRDSAEDRDRGHRHRAAELRLGAGLLLLGAAVAAGLFVGSALVIGLMFGPQFGAAVRLLRILCLAIPLLFLNFGLTHFLIARNLERRNMVFALAMVVCNVPLNFWLIPRRGAIGAAWATFATEVALTLCCLLTLRWWRPVPGPRSEEPRCPPIAPPATT